MRPWESSGLVFTRRPPTASAASWLGRGHRAGFLASPSRGRRAPACAASIGSPSKLCLHARERWVTRGGVARSGVATRGVATRGVATRGVTTRGVTTRRSSRGNRAGRALGGAPESTGPRAAPKLHADWLMPMAMPGAPMAELFESIRAVANICAGSPRGGRGRASLRGEAERHGNGCTPCTLGETHARRDAFPSLHARPAGSPAVGAPYCARRRRASMRHT